MARINKKEAVAVSQGLPTKQAILSDSRGDTVPAQIVSPTDGTPQSPAALTEGEFVFSIPAIIALGQGDYEAGVSMLEEMHTELRQLGEGMIAPQQGLAATQQ